MFFLCLLIIFLIFELLVDFLCPGFFWVLVFFLMICKDSLYIKVTKPCKYISSFDRGNSRVENFLALSYS